MQKPKCLVIGGGKGDEVPGEFDFIYLDINPDRNPDIIADAGILPVKDETYEAVFASHVLEHLNPRKYDNVLKEWYRVLKPGGEMLVKVPNLTLVAERIMQGMVEGVVYLSPSGPITPIDMIVGLGGPHVSAAMAHQWGFTRETLHWRATAAGKWSNGLVWEHRECTSYDRCELRMYGRKLGEVDWKGWDIDTDLTVSGDLYSLSLKGA
jgi:SAM-dependent methyltransferase